VGTVARAGTSLIAMTIGRMKQPHAGIVINNDVGSPFQYLADQSRLT
jgi:hypothetical protein